MPKKWEEVGELVLKEQDRQDECIRENRKDINGLLISRVSDRLTNIIYGICGIIIGTLISIGLNKLLR